MSKQLTANFHSDEFKCPCCGKDDVDMNFAINLQIARDHSDIKFVITSGVRCEKHNKEVGGKETSSHIKGLACDIAALNSSTRSLILQAVVPVFRRVGIGKDFIHVDDDMVKTQNVTWLY
jgi:uncharacterized protein YcbK (DUF882 family)|tara:strand:+ start:230 stop:589 length:360 start_codon:yes stop_codon:yes gene_type:complete